MKQANWKVLLPLFLLLYLPLQLSAQKELTLEDAVLRQWSTLAPEGLANLQWIPGGKTLSFQEGKKLLQIDATQKKSDLLTADELGKALDINLSYFPWIKWMNKNEFYFQKGKAFYSYNLKDKKGALLVELPENAENIDFHPEKGYAAYTQLNNLFFATAEEKENRITEVTDLNIVSGQAIARSEFGIRKGIFWSPQGDKLAFYQKSEANVTDYPLLDISTTPGSLRSIKYPMAGQRSENAKVGVYHFDKKQLIYLEVEGDEEQYLTNLGWGPKAEFIYLAIVNRGQDTMQLNKYNATTGKLVKTLFTETNKRYVEPEHPVWFLPNNPNEFLWQSERDGFNHLYRYNTDGKLLNQVSDGDWVVTDVHGLDYNGSHVIISGTDESGLNQYAYKANIKSGKVTQLNKVEGTHQIQLSTEGSQILDTYSNLKTPKVIQLVATQTGKQIAELLKADNPFEDYKIGTTEILTIKAQDGTPLHARMIKPSDFDPAKKYPVLVYVYGGPHAQMVTNSWMARSSRWMQYMAEQGYIIWTLDNRGSANRGFEFESVIHRQLGKLEMQDQLDGVEYLKKQPFIDGDRLAVHGWSYGGFMTTSLMLRSPGVFNAGVAGGPVTDWKYYEIMYGERYMDTPQENPDGYAENKLANYVDKLEGELLLIHGTVDDVVVMQHGLSLVKAFVDANVQVDFFPYPGHPHNVRGRDRVHLMRKVLDYVMENNE